MSFGPQVVMPGAFHIEAPNDGASLSGVHPGIFRQPVSPSPSTSMYLGRSTGSLYADPSTPGPNVKRKRQAGREPTPLNDWTFTGDTGFNMNGAAEGRRPDIGSRKISGGKRKYVLAGQINTPNGATKDLRDNMEDSVYSDIDYRRALGPKLQHEEFDSPLSRQTVENSTSGTPNTQRAWSTFAIQTIGGVVGKVWEFCKAGAFRGFYAGGGKGYDMQTPRTSAQQQTPATNSSNGQVWCNEHDVPTFPDYGPSTGGGFPQSDYSPYYYEREVPEEATTPPPPAAKRRQINDEAITPRIGTSSGRDELRKNWVVVNEASSEKLKRPSTFASRAPTGPSFHNPHRPVVGAASRRSGGINGGRPSNRFDPPPRFNRRASNRASPAGAVPAPREPASYASPRSSASVATAKAAPPVSAAAPPPTLHLHQRSPSRIPVPVSPGSRPQTSAGGNGPSAYSPAASRLGSPSPSPYAQGGSQQQQHRLTQSVAARSGKRPGSAVGISESSSSPRLDREAQKLAARRLQAERETDLRINDANARLREMIKQAKEALGTSVEVDMLDDGDGDGGGDYWEDD